MRGREYRTTAEALREGERGGPDPRAARPRHRCTIRVSHARLPRGTSGQCVVRAEGPPLLERFHVQHAAATMNFGTACSSDTSWRHIQRGGEVISVDEDPKADLQVAQHGTEGACCGPTNPLSQSAPFFTTVHHCVRPVEAWGPQSSPTEPRSTCAECSSTLTIPKSRSMS